MAERASGLWVPESGSHRVGGTRPPAAVPDALLRASPAVREAALSDLRREEKRLRRARERIRRKQARLNRKKK